ncbi:MAG: hypothetical protein U0800_13170, partial [Isosphaeraceae bacterium]
MSHPTTPNGKAGGKPIAPPAERARDLLARSRDHGAIVLLDPEAADGFAVMADPTKRPLFTAKGEQFEARLRELSAEVLALLAAREQAGQAPAAAATPKPNSSRKQALRNQVAAILRLARKAPAGDDAGDEAEDLRDRFSAAMIDYLRPRPRDPKEDPAKAREKAASMFVAFLGLVHAGEVSRRKFRKILKGAMGEKPGGRSFNAMPKLARLINRANQAQNGAGESQVQTLLRLASGAELFHTPDRRLFAHIPAGDHRETHEIGSSTFRRWLIHAFLLDRGKPPTPESISTAISALEADAEFKGVERPVSVRSAKGPAGDPAFYLDLGEAKWKAARVGPDGWSVVADPPARFRRPSGMLGLPEPRPGTLVDELGELVNVEPEDMPLLIAWLSAAILPEGPYPILVLCGEQGSAKSTCARLLRRLVDPHVSPLRAEPRETHDLMIGATNSWLLCYDNLSSLSDSLSDSLCRLSTGGGFATRRLFTDAEEVFLDAMRPTILTAIDDLVTRADLADRCVFLRLPTIGDRDRRAESELWQKFERAWPQLVGGLLSAASRGLRDRDSIRLRRMPRLADFARWGEAVCRSQGFEPDAFLDRYADNRRSASAELVDGSVLASALRDLAASDGAWEG